MDSTNSASANANAIDYRKITIAMIDDIDMIINQFDNKRDVKFDIELSTTINCINANTNIITIDYRDFLKLVIDVGVELTINEEMTLRYTNNGVIHIVMRMITATEVRVISKSNKCLIQCSYNKIIADKITKLLLNYKKKHKSL